MANVAGATLDLNNFNLAIGSLAGGGTTGGSVTLGSGTLTTGGANTATVFGGVISGTGGLTKVGTGKLTLSGGNTYTGTTTISAGTLQIGNGGATGSLGSGPVSDNAALVFDLSSAATVANVITGTGTLTQSGTGTLTLSGANTYNGVTTISAGSLQIGAGGTTGSLGSGSVTDNAALVFDLSSAVMVANVVSGTGSLAQSGTGTLTLSSANTYTGATAINAGTLQAGVTNAIPSGTAVTVANVAGATLDLNNFSDTIGSLAGGGTTGGGVTLGSGTLTTGGTNASTIFAGIISGTGGLTQSGTGTLTLFGANTYTGVTKISAGTLQIGAGGTTDSLSSGSVTDNAALVFDLSSAVMEANVVSGTGSLAQSGTGTLTLSSANTYTGATAINAGTLQAGATNAIPSGTAVTVANVAGATLDLNNFNDTIGSLAGVGTTGGSVTLGSGTLTTGGNNVSTVFGGIISGTGGLTKVGTGTFTLSGGNTYTGVTKISAGTLQIGAGGTTDSLSSGSVTDNAALVFDLSSAVMVANVVSGTGRLTQSGTGTLTLLGANTYTGTTTISAGTLQIGAGGTTDSLSSGSVTDNAALVFDLSSAVMEANVVSGTGKLTQSGTGTLTLSGANTYTGATTISAGTLQVGAANAIPSASDVIDNAMLDLAGMSATTGALSGTGTVTNSVSVAVTLTVGASNDSGTFSGVLQDGAARSR